MNLPNPIPEQTQTNEPVKNGQENLQANAAEFVDVPPGEDPELNQTLKILLESSGFQIKDPRIITVVENALAQKLDAILANTRFLGGIQESKDQKELHLLQLKPALNEEDIHIDRPEFVLEQPNLKMTTRRTKIGK